MARPQLVKDYFDERLVKRLQVPKTAQAVTLELKFSYARVAVP